MTGKKRSRDAEEEATLKKKAKDDTKYFAQKFVVFGRLYIRPAVTSGILAKTTDDPDFDPATEFQTGTVEISVLAKAVLRDAAPLLKDGWDEVIRMPGFWTQVIHL